MIQKIVDNIIESNNLEGFLPEIKVKLVHNETLVLFLNFDGTFFVTIKSLKICEFSEEKLALLIAYEMAHYLLDHSQKRVTEGLYQSYFKKKWFKTS